MVWDGDFFLLQNSTFIIACNLEGRKERRKEGVREEGKECREARKAGKEREKEIVKQRTK